MRLIDDYPGISFVDISQATGMERSKTSRILRSLIELGLVQREAVDGDARRYQLFTTNLGKERRQVARRLSDRLESVLLRPLSESDLSALQRSLEVLGNWIRCDEYMAELKEAGTEFGDE